MKLFEIILYEKYSIMFKWLNNLCVKNWNENPRVTSILSYESHNTTEERYVCVCSAIQRLTAW